MHPLAHRQGALREFVQCAAHGAVGLGRRVRATHLSQHLLLADDRGIQTAGHREQMLDGRLRVADIGVFGQVIEGHTGALSEHLPDHRQTAVEGLDHRIHLDAVAGGKHHGLGNQ